jgi:hypothetical protein
MGVVLEFLGKSFVTEKVASHRAMLAEHVKPLAMSKLRRVFRTQNAEEPYQLRELTPIRLRTEYLMELAAFEHAQGAEANVVRSIYRQAAEQWVPIVKAMDLRPRIFELCLGDAPRLADALKVAFNAKVTKIGRDFHVRYKARPQPLHLEVMEEALVSAAISADRNLARRIAKAYKVNDSDPMHDLGHFVVLRHLLAEDDVAAAAVAKQLRPGYPADWPPELIEFPIGVVKRDERLLAKGLRTLNTRFAGQWNQQLWHARYKKLNSEPKPRYRRTFEEMLHEVRRFLLSMNWLMSPYALAYLNIAAWRGMKSPFDRPEMFSEWIPLSLCVGSERSSKRNSSDE